MKKVLITGGTGFIGSRLALACLGRGDQVTVLGQGNNPSEVENEKVLEASGACVQLVSIMDHDRLGKIVKGVDVVYHLAAAQHEANVPDQRFWDVNVTGTRNILEASVKAGVKRFVHGSTIGVYGSGLAGTIDENSPLRPDNIYGVTKLEGEKVVLSYHKQLPVAVIRISETYGPGDFRLLKLFKAIQKKIFFMIGSGRNMHHLVFIEDLIQGLFLTASQEKVTGKVFVISGKGALTSNEMVGIIADELGNKIPGFHAPLFPFIILATAMEKVLRPMGIQPPLHRRRMDFFKKSFVFSQEATSQSLGFSPQIGFRDGVSETIKWYRGSGFL